MIERACANHPDRRAIAVCVMTGKPICGECSTRYEGVNYSKEGLELLRARRGAGGHGGVRRAAAVAALLLTPVLLAGAYVFFWLTFFSLMGLPRMMMKAAM